MKNKYTLFALLVIAILGTSCNDEWKDEQYTRYVSFSAPLNDQGTTNVYVPYTRKTDGAPMFGSGKSSYQLPIIVSGSTTNDRDITVHVAHDPDTLVALNQARYSTRTDLYYRDMGTDQTNFVAYNSTAQVNANERVGLLNLNFDFNNIDLSEKWVLPLQVVNDASLDYVAHPRKNYAKAMLRIFPFNDYSGDYAGTLLTFKVVTNEETNEETSESITKNQIRAYVVDDKSVFTYAGVVDEDYNNRKRYKVDFNFVRSDNEFTENGVIELSCKNAADIGFKVNPDVTTSYRVVSVMDEKQPYLEHRYVIISNIDYYFNYITSEEGGVKKYVRYHVAGSMTLERKINTQIPDEDQAIEW